MAHAPSLAEARRQFAEELRVVAHIQDERVIDAFATVPRERFVGPGPWRLPNFFDGYWTTSARNDEEAGALARALADPVGQRAVKCLRRDRHDADESCWLNGDGWCLSKRELH